MIHIHSSQDCFGYGSVTTNHSFNHLSLRSVKQEYDVCCIREATGLSSAIGFPALLSVDNKSTEIGIEVHIFLISDQHVLEQGNNTVAIEVLRNLPNLCDSINSKLDIRYFMSKNREIMSYIFTTDNSSILNPEPHRILQCRSDYECSNLEASEDGVKSFAVLARVGSQPGFRLTFTAVISDISMYKVDLQFLMLKQISNLN